jgi:hypothetical protein
MREETYTTVAAIERSSGTVAAVVDVTAPENTPSLRPREMPRLSRWDSRLT